MKEKTVNDLMLFQYIYETLPEKDMVHITRLIDQDNRYKKRYQLLLKLVKKEGSKEPEISSKKVDIMYNFFVKTKLKTYSTPRSKKVFQLALGFSAAGLLLVWGLNYFFRSPSEQMIEIRRFKTAEITINNKKHDLSKMEQLPFDKIITTREGLDIVIKNNAVINAFSKTKFIIAREPKNRVTLYQGTILVETIRQKDVSIKVNHFIINPVGTVFKIQYDNDLLTVFLKKGEIEILNEEKKDKLFLQSARSNMFIYNFKNQEKEFVQAEDAVLEFYYLGMKYKDTHEWPKTVYLLEQFLKENKKETAEKYDAMYILGILYFEKLNNKDRAYNYFKTILNSRFSYTYSDKLKKLNQ